jgi:hypothetical protein
MDRFAFQRQVVADSTGVVLNVGANEDPAHLKAFDPDRVVNCDIEDWDSHMNRPNYVDKLFDAAKERWPFEDDSAELVVFGDILEHLKPADCSAVLNEARRVAERLCITVPREVRPEIFEQTPPDGNPYMFHQVEVTEDYLRGKLQEAGWSVDEWLTVDYGFVPEGYLVTARRSE